MTKGIIIPLFNRFISVCEFFNLVERLKTFFDSSRSRVVVESYILFKWLMVIIAIVIQLNYNSSCVLLDIIVYYLLFYNTYTYIKYHAFPSFANKDKESIVRRLILVSQGFMFVVLCYVYFYLRYSFHFDWSNFSSIYQAAIIQSISTSFVSTNTSSFPPNDFAGNLIILSQIIHSYLYIGILIIQTFIEE